MLVGIDSPRPETLSPIFPGPVTLCCESPISSSGSVKQLQLFTNKSSGQGNSCLGTVVFDGGNEVKQIS